MHVQFVQVHAQFILRHRRQVLWLQPGHCEAQTRAAVRQGRLAFALIIPPDFSANAVLGTQSGADRLLVYASEGDNYNGAYLARRFAAELGYQVNETLDEKRWALVLGASADAGASVPGRVVAGRGNDRLYFSFAPFA